MNNQPTNMSTSGMNAQLGQSTRQALSQTSQAFDQLVQQIRSSIGQVQEPKAQALLETSAEVLLGLKKAFDDYQKGNEEAWQ